ncbi:MAG TPA: DNA polymerase III subunit gamma/tau, partial [Burkholderiaceae bacterium]|nr:DNA polymerase III subunit gamma/tau [Burkholderiaceae bacterium]
SSRASPDSRSAAASAGQSRLLAGSPEPGFLAGSAAAGEGTDMRKGLAATRAALRSELVAHVGDHITLRVPVKALLEAGNDARVRAALSEHFGRPIRLTTQVGAISGATAASRNESARAARQKEAEDAIYADPFVRELIENFGASVDPRSIRPAKPDA